MARTVRQSVVRLAVLLLTSMLLGGCASTSAPQQSGASTPGDPLEPLNRRIYGFNRSFDQNIAEPVARGYKTVTPEPIDNAVTNFFNNLDDVSVLANSLLQLKGRKAAATTLRLALNTTFGVFGLIDIAGAAGIHKENEDFGQTLGYWGLGSGPYLVLPVLGPSTLRDGPARAVDAYYLDPLDEIATSDDAYYGAYALYAVDARADLLGTTRIVDTAALDPYAYTREAWLQRRAAQVHDGQPPSPSSAPPGDKGFNPFSDEDDDLFEDSVEPENP